MSETPIDNNENSKMKEGWRVVTKESKMKEGYKEVAKESEVTEIQIDNDETNKIKEQYNIEKDNEEQISKEITVIMKNCATQKDLIDFTGKIREYKTRIYELKMQLKEELSKAYSMKEGKRFTRMDIRNNIEIEAETARIYLLREHFLIDKTRENMNCGYGIRKGEESNEEKNVRRICSEINIILATRIFKYYEKEIAFWEEMNLKKMMEIDDKERCFE